MTNAVLLSPTTGAIAQSTLAADAAAVLQWIRLVSMRPSVAEVSAAVDALCRLRTALRSLRPILDRCWSVRLRAGLAPTHEALATVVRIDEEIRLVGDLITEPTSADIDRMNAQRRAAVATAETARDPATHRTLMSLADGTAPAPLRTAAPLGDAHQPARHVLPAMLYRRWRKLVRETEPTDLPTMQRRTREFLIIADLAARGGLDIAEPVLVARRLLHSVEAAIHVDLAYRVRTETASGTVRTLTRLGNSRKAASRAIATAYAEFAAIDGRLVVPATAAAKSAAGGLIVRPSKKGTQVLLVHRVRHNDWSIPKGAAIPGESAEQCALREVREETGLTCRLQRELHNVSYRDRNRRWKLVRYWVMTPIEKVGQPDPREIDETRWVRLKDAESLVSRERERAVLTAYRHQQAMSPPAPAKAPLRSRNRRSADTMRRAG